jgi:putative transposase
MAEENPAWGAPRIHGELLKLGLDVSERTVSRYYRRLSPPVNAGRLWATFLRNQREIIAAMDFFTVPTLTFRVLYCFFVIEHGRRRILHFNVTEHPTGPWIVQQLRETFRESCQYRYAILDRDGKLGGEVAELLTSSGMKPTRTSAASPWQNGIAERWIGSCRRELLDHVIVLNDAHLRRLIRDYISYYHEDRVHDSLEKDTPAMRPVSSKPGQSARLVSLPRIGGLHHSIRASPMSRRRRATCFSRHRHADARARYAAPVCRNGNKIMVAALLPSTVGSSTVTPVLSII